MASESNKQVVGVPFLVHYCKVALNCLQCDHQSAVGISFLLAQMA